MRVLQIISSGGMYGAEAVVLELAWAFEAQPHASFLSVFDNGSPAGVQIYHEAAKRQLPAALLPCRGPLDRAVLPQLRSVVARFEPNVVHAHGYKADLYAWAALRGRGVPLVSTCHGWHGTGRMLPLYNLLDRMALRSFDRVATASTEIALIVRSGGVPPEKIAMIHNGIDTAPFDSATPSLEQTGAPVAGIVGRLSREKNVDVFLRAAAEVLRQLPSASFVVVGTGPEREPLERLAAELGIADRVRFLGRRDDIPNLLASLDVVVSASRQEGLPILLLEAMASGRAIVATTVGEVPAAIENGVSGLLVAPDDAGALASAICQVLSDKELQRRLGSAARQRVQTEFSCDRMIRSYLRLYESAIAHAKSK